MNAQILNPYTVPLSGIRVIEASAGTGKTFTITKVYLRLLLGLSDGSHPPLEPNQILVMTFTTAATAELKARIFAAINQCLTAFKDNDINDEIVALWHATEGSDVSQAIKRLTLASRLMDDAEINTIHSFASRLLRQFSLEANVPPNFEVTTESKALEALCTDFWRAEIMPQPLISNTIFHDVIKSPKELHTLIKRLVNFSPQQFAEHTPFNQLSKHLTEASEQLCKTWCVERDEIVSDFNSANERGQINKTKWREDKLTNHISAFDRCLDDRGMLRYAYNKIDSVSLDSFSSKYIASSIKAKGQPLPNRAFYQLVDDVLANLADIKLSILAHSVEWIQQHYNKREQHDGIIHTDRLMYLANQFLQGPGKSLLPTLRQQWPVALIDEFQDTDPEQWAAFQQIYLADNANTGLLLIGDPKQAIYAFRQADLKVYLSAAKSATTPNGHFTMDRNWRSESGVLDATEALFSVKSDPFINKDIEFTSVKPSPEHHTKALMHHGKNVSGIEIGFHNTPGEKPPSADEARHLTCQATALKIAEMIQPDSGYSINGRAVQPEDIAILIRGHHEAAFVQAALSELNINSSLESKDSVFKSDEALAVLSTLRAIANPRSERHTRNLMAQGIWHFSSAQLSELFNDLEQWDHWVKSLEAARDTWSFHGPLSALTQLLDQLGLNTRLMMGESSQRSISNWWQVAELCQERHSQHLGLDGLINWMVASISGELKHAAELRLDSDAKRVKIMTVHKSKGLQFPIVFLPFLSSPPGNRGTGLNLVYRNNQRLLAASNDTDARMEVSSEELQEQVRLIYVALTRAESFCGIHLSPVKDIGKSTFCMLLDQRVSDFESTKRLIQEINLPSLRLSVASTSQENFDFDAPEEAPIRLANRLNRSVERNRTITSYSALTRGMSHSLAITKEESNTEIAERFTLDKGAHVGNFLHAALEYIDFDRFNDPSVASELSVYMTQFGVTNHEDPNRVNAYRRWLNDVVNTPYLGDLSLRLLNPSDRLAEMEFNLPIQDDLQASRLNRLVRDYLDHPLAFESVRGHLKGYIDLSFRHDGKYYVADYKSNYLGDHFDLYDQTHLEVAVRASGYTLQFLIYALAMHRHLGARLANYHYERDFGGVYYFYLRGMTPERSTGIYFYKPPLELIESLDSLFGSGARHDD